MTTATTRAAAPERHREGRSPLPVTRKDRDEAVRRLTADGYAVTGAQAWHLIKRWRNRNRRDVDHSLGDLFYGWAKPQLANLTACDQSIGGPNWRTSA